MIAKDLHLMAVLFSHAAEAASYHRGKLTVPPMDDPLYQVWERDDARLKAHIERFANYSSNFASLSVTSALAEIWPELEALEQITEDAEEELKRIAELNAVFARLAQIMELAQSVLTLAATRNIAAIGDVVEKFEAVRKTSA